MKKHLIVALVLSALVYTLAHIKLNQKPNPWPDNIHQGLRDGSLNKRLEDSAGKPVDTAATLKGNHPG